MRSVGQTNESPILAESTESKLVETYNTDMTYVIPPAGTNCELLKLANMVCVPPRAK